MGGTSRETPVHMTSWGGVMASKWPLGLVSRGLAGQWLGCPGGQERRGSREWGESWQAGERRGRGRSSSRERRGAEGRQCLPPGEKPSQ